MAAQTGFYMDLTDFDKGFDRIMKKYPQLCADGMFKKVGPRIISDAIKVEPLAPHLWGELKKSQRITKPVIIKGEIHFFMGFNIAYAVHVHEGLVSWHWSLKGSGPKFLEAKLQWFAREYLKLVADYVNKILGSMK